MTIIQTTLAKSPQFYDKTLELIEEAFNYPAESSFETDFYNLIEPSNHRHNHLFIEGETVVGHIGVNLRELKKGDSSSLVAFVGGIAINEQHQGRGLFNKLFQSVLELYTDSCSLILLWSNKSKLYEKYNFFQFGSVLQTGEKNEDQSYFSRLGFEKEELKNLSIKEIGDLSCLYDNNFKDYIAPKRSTRDWDTISNITTTQLYIRREEKKISDYFFINKGFDLKDVIHESSFFNNLDTIRSLQAYKLWLPQNFKNTIEHTQAIYVGLIRIGNEAMFSNFINKLFAKDLEVKEIQDKMIQFTFKNELFTLETSEFITMLFGPNSIKEFSGHEKNFFIPGLDSI